MVHYNSMSPFPIYDTEYVKDVRKKIKEMEENEDYNYDEDSVVACKYCKSLHIVSDIYSNDHCMRCGSINELQEYKNIFDYKTNINKED